MAAAAAAAVAMAVVAAVAVAVVLAVAAAVAVAPAVAVAVAQVVTLPVLVGLKGLLLWVEMPKSRRSRARFLTFIGSATGGFLHGSTCRGP